MTADRKDRAAPGVGGGGRAPSLRPGRSGLRARVVRAALRPGVVAAAVAGLALAIRLPLFEFVSHDGRQLLRWFAFFEENGHFLAFRSDDITNYNPLYLYLMAGLSFLEDSIQLTALKAVSVAFDFAMAFFAYRIARLKDEESKWTPVFAGAAALFLPTVVLNGAMWGQCDSITTTFLLACVCSLLAGRRTAAFAWFGLALAFKPQAVFLAPFLFWLWMRKEVRLRDFLAVPSVFLLTLVPAWLLGRPAGELLSTYLVELRYTERRLTMQAHNLYQWVPEDWLPAWPLFLLAAGFVVAGAGFVVRRSRARFTPEVTVFLATFSVLLMPFILPKMHDRYFFAAEVFSLILAFYFRRYWHVPIVLVIASSINYFRALLDAPPLAPLHFVALAPLVLLVVLGRGLLSALGPFAPMEGEPRWRARWSALRRSPAFPIALLLASLAVAASFSAVRHGFYRTPASDNQTYNGMARASNLSADHGYLVFHRRVLEPEGEVRYEPHNRFPVGGLFLIKAVIAPFGSLSAQLLAARLLMVVFFAAAMLAAYLSLRRLTSHRYIALMATLLAVSSYYWHHLDQVGTEHAMDLFAVLLTFHGMVVFVREGRFRQLLLKTGAALLVGWHVYALLAPFLALGFLRERFRVSSFRETKYGFRIPGRIELDRPLRKALRSRYLALGVFALVFGLAVLTWGFALEYRALDGEGGLAGMPSYQSFLYRTGLSEQLSERYASALAWGPFLEQQFHRLGRMALPYGLPGYAVALGDFPSPPGDVEGVLLGVFVTVTALAWAAAGPARLLYLTLALSGFCWALPMRNEVAFHDSEMIFYFGVVLVFFTAFLRYLRRVAGDRLVGRLVPAVLLLFGLSAHRIAGVYYQPGPAYEFGELLDDYDEIRRLTSDAVVFVSRDEFGGADYEIPQSMSWFLSGRVMAYRADLEERSGFSIRRRREPGPALVTPRNRAVFLYDRALESGSLDRMVAEGSPEIRSTFDVYHSGDWLIYVREPCAVPDTEARFFLHLFPVDESRLPPGSTARRFENRDFDYADHALRSEGQCLAAVRLPEYEVRSAVTGQFRRRVDGTYENLWRGEFVLGAAAAGPTGAAEAPDARRGG